MKQILLTFVAALCLSAYAADQTPFKSGDFYFRILDETAKTAEVVSNPNAGEGYCNDAETFTIPSTVTTDNGTYTVVSIADRCFANAGQASKTTIFYIPTSVTNVGDEAFVSNNNYGIRVLCPSTLVTIGERAFAHTTQKHNSIILRNTKSIGKGAFYDTDIKGAYIFSQNMTSLPDSCFYGCKDLAIVRISASVTEIGNGCFGGCTSLTTMVNEASTPQSVTNEKFVVDAGKYVWQTAGAKLLVADEASKSAYAADDVWKNFTIEPHDISFVKLDGTCFYPTSTPLLYADSTKVEYNKNGKTEDIHLEGDNEITISKEMGLDVLTSLSVKNIFYVSIMDRLTVSDTVAIKNMKKTDAKMKSVADDGELYSVGYQEGINSIINSAMLSDAMGRIYARDTTLNYGGKFKWNNLCFDGKDAESGTLTLNTPEVVYLKTKNDRLSESVDKGSATMFTLVIRSGYPWADKKDKYNGKVSWNLTDDAGNVILSGDTVFSHNDASADKELVDSINVGSTIIPYSTKVILNVTFPDGSKDSYTVNVKNGKNAVLDMGGGVYMTYEVTTADQELNSKDLSLSPENTDPENVLWFDEVPVKAVLALIRPKYTDLDTLKIAPSITGEAYFTDYYGKEYFRSDFSKAYAEMLPLFKRSVKFTDQGVLFPYSIASTNPPIAGEYKYGYKMSIGDNEGQTIGTDRSVIFVASALTTATTESNEVAADETFTVKAQAFSGYPYDVYNWQNTNETVIVYIPEADSLKEYAKILIPLNASTEKAKLAYYSDVVTQTFCLKDANASKMIFKVKDNGFMTTILEVNAKSTPTAISTIQPAAPKAEGYYSIDGKYLGTNQTLLPKGIYIQGGRKIVVK